MTLVSVITPTWDRHELLIGRCIPSVVSQTYKEIEHVVISDGPDPLLEKLLTNKPVVYGEVGCHDDHPNNWGSEARNYGLDVANGELIAYLDDDNAWRPEHLQKLVDAMDANPDADFAYSRMRIHPGEYEVGSAPPSYGHLDSSLLMHRRGLAKWPLPGTLNGDQHAPDWGVVALWLGGGARWAFVPEVTVDYFSRT